MLRNYFKTAFRSLARNKAFTLINILGLVIGISFSTMLYTYVKHELSYDSFHSKSDRTYRVLTINKSIPDDIRTFGSTMPPLGPELVTTFPEVVEFVRLYRFTGQVIIEVGETKYSERNWFTADSNFFNVFNFDFVEGNPLTALSQPRSVILPEKIAKKYFGNENALGKTINFLDLGLITVTGIVKDLPTNSHLQFDLLFSDLQPGDFWDSYITNWKRLGAFTYVVLQEGASISEVDLKMNDFMKKHRGDDAQFIATAFQPIKNIYLHSAGIQNGLEFEHGQLSYVYIFSSMAVFLLLIAAINYINLTTSKASARTKEIGIRKVAGAFKAQLIVQFLTEAFLITLISMLLALVMMDLTFPYFNSITGKNFDLTLTTLIQFLPSLLIITLIIGVIAGSYPAFYLAKLKPISTLKNQTAYARGGFDLRTTLVVFQFTITIVLIISTLVIGNQLNFIQTKDIGFQKDHLMIIDINSGTVRNQFQAMKNEFSKLAGVQHVAVSSRVPGEWKNIREVFAKNASEADSKGDSLQTYFMGFDEDMLDTYQIELVAGKYFSGNNEADSMNVVINTSAAKALNLKSPVGTILKIGTGDGEWNAHVIGVLNDFNFQSLHQKVAPIIIGYRNNPIQSIDYFTLKVSGDPTNLIAGATKVNEQFDADSPIEYHFLTDQLDTFYVSEKKAGMIFQMGGVLSIVVGCLGLLGLANYHVERRTKELGIRKVLGAGSMNLFFMVSFSFTKQVVLAFVLACPIAWYVMRQWLNVFEYRVALSADVFILSGMIVLLLALVTVSYQSLKAARFNPVEALKNE
jgi:putative ABC transport system permease protein